MNKNNKCLVCESQKLIKLPDYYEKNGLVKCDDCGFVFMEKIPSLQDLSEYYKDYSYAGQIYKSAITVKSYNALLDEFEKYRKTNKILDVGCGRGWFLEEAKKRGWEVFGTEYSEAAIALCKSNGLDNIKAGKLDPESFSPAEFDVITSFEVFEHINNPNEEIQHINQLLRKGGLFYCTTPNFNSLMRYYLKTDYNVIVYPEHLSYYTKNTLNKLAFQNGFKLLKFQTTGISLNRLKDSDKTNIQENTEIISRKESSDEKLRENIEKKWYLGFAKKMANELMTITSTGMTLKGYYIKN